MSEPKIPSPAPAQERLHVDGTDYGTQLTRKFRERKPWIRRDPRRVRSFIPGLILEVLVRPGDPVRRGQGIAILEAMKMQNEVLATADGVVRAVHVEPGQLVAKGELLAELD
jgi:biotin carboxyl carrier protein